MSTWAGPYFQLVEASGAQRSWTPPVDLPLTPAPGASLADLGAPGAKVRVRWRTPMHANPRSLTGVASDPALLTLACRIAAAAAVGGAGWAPDATGAPVPIPLNAVVPLPPTPPSPLPQAIADLPVFAAFPPVPTGYRREAISMSQYVAELIAGRRALGSTVAEAATHLRLTREAGWGPTNRSNKNNILGFIEQILVYREPAPTDPVEVAAHMRAVLAIPGVEVGAPMHIALVTAADLAYALEVRRTTDRRTQLLNAQAEARYAKAQKTFEERQARYVAGLTRHRPTPPAATRSESPWASFRSSSKDGTDESEVLARDARARAADARRGQARASEPHVRGATCRGSARHEPGDAARVAPPPRDRRRAAPRRADRRRRGEQATSP